jgi:hypothetical protein
VSHSAERRAAPRCSAVQNQSRIEFATGQDRRRIAAQLINISRDGALVATENPPPCATPISLRIESPVRTDWVDAVIVRLDHQRQVGVRFIQGCCPDDLLLAGTVGIDIAFMVRDGPNLTTAFD